MFSNSVIPNVYQAAYMQGLVNNKKPKNTGGGLIKRTVSEENRHQRFLAISEANPFEVNIENKKTGSKKVYTYPQTEDLIPLFQKKGIKKFPTDSVRLNSGNFNTKKELEITPKYMTNFVYTNGEGYENTVENSMFKISAKKKGGYQPYKTSAFEDLEKGGYYKQKVKQFSRKGDAPILTEPSNALPPNYDDVFDSINYELNFEDINDN